MSTLPSPPPPPPPPPSDPGPPAPPRRRRTGLVVAIVAAVVLVLALAGAAGALLLVGNAKADGYDDEVAAWVQEHRDTLVELTEALPEDLYKVDLGDRIEDLEDALERQDEACEHASDPLERISEAIDSFPTLSGPWGLLSSSFRSASDRSAERSEELEEFESVVREVFEQVQADCDWNVGLQRALVDSEIAWIQTQGYLLQPGEVTDEGTCDHDNGCYPFDLQEREAYLQARQAAWTIMTDDVRDVYAGRACAATSLAKLCDAQLDWIDASAAAEAGYVAAVRAYGDGSGAEVEAAIALADQVEVDQAATFRTILFKAFPQASEDEDLQAAPGWTEAILDLADRLLLEELAGHREALEAW